MSPPAKTAANAFPKPDGARSAGSGSSDSRGSGSGRDSPRRGRFPADPARALPADGRPLTLAIALVAVYGVGTAVAGLSLVAASYRDAAEGILVWGIAWLVVGAPMALLVGLVGWRAECLLAAARSNATWWGGFAASAISAAHWVPLCLWSPALAAGILVDPTEADVLLGSVFVAVGPWILTAAAVAATLFSVGRLEARDWRGVPRGAPRPPIRIPSALLAASAYGLASFLPGLVWLEWVERTAWARAGLLTLGVWALVGAGAGALAGALLGRFVERGAGLAPGLAERFRARQLELAGATFAAHWLPVFAFAVAKIPVEDPDPRFSFLLASVLAVVVGTATMSIARVSRTMPAAAR